MNSRSEIGPRGGDAPLRRDNWGDSAEESHDSASDPNLQFKEIGNDQHRSSAVTSKMFGGPSDTRQHPSTCAVVIRPAATQLQI